MALQTIKLLLSALGMSSLLGCSPMTTVAPDGTIAYHHFGYVKVIVPNTYSSTDKTVSATDVSTLGIRLQNGIGVGYFRDKQVVVPLDCHTVFLVSNQEQLDKAISTLNEIHKTEGVCAAIYR